MIRLELEQAFNCFAGLVSILESNIEACQIEVKAFRIRRDLNTIPKGSNGVVQLIHLRVEDAQIVNGAGMVPLSRLLKNPSFRKEAFSSVFF